MEILFAALLVAVGVSGLVAATVGSLRRDREFERRYRSASESERRDLERLRPSSLSWTWVNSHLKPRWAIAIYLFLAVVLAATCRSPSPLAS